VSDIQQAIREAIVLGLNTDERFADEVLTTRFPQACQTCNGSRERIDWADEEHPLVLCGHCPTLGQLLLWGVNVAMAEVHPFEVAVGDKGESYEFATGLLDALRVEPS